MKKQRDSRLQTRDARFETFKTVNKAEKIFVKPLASSSYLLFHRRKHTKYTAHSLYIENVERQTVRQTEEREKVKEQTGNFMWFKTQKKTISYVYSVQFIVCRMYSV